MDIEGKLAIKNKDNLRSLNKGHPTVYKTSDLYLGAFLKTKGIFLQRAAWENGRVIFVFQNHDRGVGEAIQLNTRVLPFSLFLLFTLLRVGAYL